MNTKQKSNQIDMLHGSLMKKLLLFALPLAASSILQQLFNSADVAVVGRYAGSDALAAVGSNASVIALFVNLFVGLSVGANVVIANYIGQRQTEKVQDVVHTVILFGIISGVVMLLLGQVIARPILTMINTPSEVLDLAVLYLRIYFIGMPFIVVYNFGAAILRSIGDTKRPLYCLIISGVINVALNLLLVVVFHMGVAGVSIATDVANAVSAGIVLYALLHEKEPIRLYFNRLRIHKESLLRVLRIGAPSAIQTSVFSLSNVCIQSGINSFGPNAVAGSSTALNFEYFTYYTISAFSQAAVTFIGQNYGAGKYDRCKKIFKWSMMEGMVITALMSMTFILGRQLFVRFYTTDDAVIEYALIRMFHVMAVEFLTGSYEISGASLRGMGYSVLPAVLTIFGSCVFRLIWLFVVFPKAHTFAMLMNAYPVSWIFTGTMMLIAYIIVRKRVLNR